MKENKKYVRIQSTMNIAVTPGLQAQDVTNKDAHVGDRLKVQSLWPKATVNIYEGVGTYPAYITEWNTVKALAKDRVLTIGEYVNEAIKNEDEQIKEELDNNLENINEISNIEIVEKERLRKLKNLKEKATTKLSDLVEE